MVFVYALSNDINSEIYVGMSVDPERRLKEHNGGQNRYTKAFKPWRIIYMEECSDYKTGRVREKYLKSSSGKKFIQKQLNSQGRS